MKIFHVRIDREVTVSNAITFMARDRTMVEEAYAGDIIGLHNHGTMRIGDTFTQKEPLRFGGIPNFAPEIFRRTQIKNPMKMKALQKGLDQLTERERLALMMRDVEGMPAEEVARELNCSQATVRSHIANARIKFRKYLERRKA